MAGALDGRVALVTGASKNIGKGMALEVAASGAVTYITARTLEDAPGQLGSLARTAAEIAAAGGQAVPLACDHTDDAQVAAVFDRIAADHGRLDVLVNVASPDFSDMVGVSFWELPFESMTRCLDVGPRSNFVTTVLAARLMIPQRSGVVINISSHGSGEYLLSVPYGAGKAAIDKITADTALELQEHGVAVVSLWPGLVLTEGLMSRTTVEADGTRTLRGLDISFGESPKLNG
jgi:NAD(P)-dependent dehydrogenase (short-subunit alcohol dehydrogenase family)